MNIIKERTKFFQQLDRLVPKQLQKLWQFGCESLVSHTITSMRSNARLLGLNWYTAKSKAYRLTKNLKFRLFFPMLMVKQGMVIPQDIIAVDFSDFGDGKWVLMFAKQTKKGRTIPIYFEILEKSNARGFQNTFIINALMNFEQLLSFKPCLIFDRGFTAPSIVAYLCKNRWKFVLRVRKMKTVTDLSANLTLKVKGSQKKDFLAYVYDHDLRIVISEQKPGMDEPWFLVTNDFNATRNTIINRYYHRFEIEEFFRDAKRLLGLEWVTCKQINTLYVILWFTVLSCWFLWHIENIHTEQDHEQKLRQSMGLSIIRYWFEQMKSQFYCFGLKAALENSA